MGGVDKVELDKYLSYLLTIYTSTYRVFLKKWGFVFWATFEGLKRAQIKKFKIRHPH